MGFLLVVRVCVGWKVLEAAARASVWVERRGERESEEGRMGVVCVGLGFGLGL